MFNITESPESKVWFFSDPHLGHLRDFVWEARGYTSPDHHTDSIIDGINAEVKANDILICLGDLCLNSTPAQVDGYLDRIICQNFWCLFGNHNNPHEKTIYLPGKNKICSDPRIRWVYPVKHKNMSYIGHYVEMTVNNQFIVLCHYPLISWNHLTKGSWMLCGHEHGNLPATRPEATDGKILDVGWDLFKKPLSFNELKVIMDKKTMCSVGHHGVHD
jgi:calcineurin-like phosphoesterase family protein